MRVADWMTREVVTVTPKTSVANARRLLNTYAIRHLPVVDGDRVVGMLSSHDLRMTDDVLRQALDTLGAELAEGRFRPVATLMTVPVYTVSPDDPLPEVARLLISRQVGAVPVVDAGRLVGILSLVDCVRAWLATDADPPAGSVHVARGDDRKRHQV